MSVNLSIIGLPQSGRTSVFNALTKGAVDLSSHLGTTNMGIAKVPDERLSALRNLFAPKKFTLAEVRYIEAGSGVKAISSNILNQIAQSDALVSVIRAFDEENSEDSNHTGALHDIEELFLEIAFSDMGIIEKRLERIVSQARIANAAERSRLNEEEALMLRLQKGLEGGLPIRQMALSPNEESIISSYRFLSQKPMITIINISENNLEKSKEIENYFKERFNNEGQDFIALCASLEAELSELPAEECADMCNDFGIEEPGLNRVIRKSFALLNLISFFTVGSDEVRAWPIVKGTTAQKAAGKIHTDIERGFIRAEVVCCDDLLAKKTIPEVKKTGLLRLEGKTYVVVDGDVINFLFNV